MRKILIIFVLCIVGCNQQNEQTLGNRLKVLTKNGTIIPQNPLQEAVLDKIQLFIYEQQIAQENIQVLLYLLEIDPNNAIFLKGYKQNESPKFAEIIMSALQGSAAAFNSVTRQQSYTKYPTQTNFDNMFHNMAEQAHWNRMEYLHEQQNWQNSDLKQMLDQGIWDKKYNYGIGIDDMRKLGIYIPPRP